MGRITKPELEPLRESDRIYAKELLSVSAALCTDPNCETCTKRLGEKEDFSEWVSEIKSEIVSAKS